MPEATVPSPALDSAARASDGSAPCGTLSQALLCAYDLQESSFREAEP